MIDYLRISIFPFLLATAISFLATPLVIKLAWKLKIVDDPAKHKHPKVVHTEPTPRGGGLAIFIAIVISALAFLPLDQHLIGILGGLTVILIMGLFDDLLLAKGKDFSPFIRLAIQFAAAAIPI